jgi:hypothetical protein
LVKIMKEEKEDVEANEMRNARSKALYWESIYNIDL